MKCTIPEISWHNRDPVLSADFQYEDKRIRRLATGGTDSHVLIWIINVTNNGQVEVEFAADLARHNRAVNAVRFSPDGKILASGDDEAAIWLWKLSEKDMPDIFGEENENKEHWTPWKALRSHMEDICDICWSPDSRFLISGSVDNTAILWDVQKGRNIGILSDHKGFVQGVTWDPKNEFVATLSSDRFCRVYNINSQKVLHKIHKLKIPDSEEGTQCKQVRMYHDDTLKSFCRRLTFTPNGEILITPAGQLEIDDDKRINVSYMFSRCKFKKPALYLRTGDKCAVAIRCCPVLFQLRDINKVKLSEEFKKKMKENPEKNFTTFDLPYRIVFAVATLNSILLYDTQQPLPLAHTSNLHYTRLTDITWSQDGVVLAASSTDGYCSFITFAEGELGTPYEETRANEEKIAENTVEIMEVTTSEENKKMDEEINLIPEETSKTCERLAESNREESKDICMNEELKEKVLSSSQPKTEPKISCDDNIEEKMESQEIPTQLKTTDKAQDSTKSLSGSVPKPPRRIQLITLSSPKQLKFRKKSDS